MELNHVDWEAARSELAAELGRAATPARRRKLAALSSLGARFTDDQAIAARQARTALRLEPLDPVHRVRAILVKLRFGDLGGALADIDALPEGVSDLPRVLILKAFATLHRGEATIARNIADRAIQIDPGCAAARFLHVEAMLHAQRKGGLDKLAELPRGPELEPAWADLLAKFAVLRPGDHRAVTAQLERGVIARGSRAEALVRTVIQWASPTQTAEELTQIAEHQVAGSRGEELTLVLLAARLAGDPAVACTTLRAMAERHTGRSALRRTLVAALTRLAVAEAGAERLTTALRLVQTCAELEPFEPLHQQNRAVLFTLLGEHTTAQDAWAELDQLHYRLALLGRIDPPSATRYAAPHRMFALAARLSPGTTRDGVFVVETSEHGTALEVNQDGVDRDPEQLRQWLHHSRAALTFELLALGNARDRVLLGPSTPAEATARAEGICLLARSLEVLVREEGRQLAELLAARFRALAVDPPQRYRPTELDPEAERVQRHAIELYAELARLCLEWQPGPGQSELVAEVVESVRAVAPLFDDHALAALIRHAEQGPPSALGFLRGMIPRLLDIPREDRERPLEPQQRARLGNLLAARLRVQLIYRRWHDAGEAECEPLADEIDLIRRDDPANPFLEFVAASVLAQGRFFDDAARAIAAFHRIAKPDDPLHKPIGRLEEALEKARKDERGKSRSHRPPAPVRAGLDFAAREAELSEQPAAIPLYVELCHDLGLAGRWSEAHAWAQHAIARCLTPASQLRARELALELVGLEQLSARDAEVVTSYLAGARAAALSTLDMMARGGAGLEYVRGLCLLAADRRDDARAAFRAALDACDRGIYLAVFRPLAADVEHALLEAARREIETACKDSRFADAYARIVERLATVTAPAPYLLELARVQFAALVPTVGTENQPAAAPPIAVAAAWSDALAAALAVPDPVARTRAVLELAIRHHEPGLREAQSLGRKLDELEAQLADIAVIERANACATAGNLAGALAALGELGPRADRNPRSLRLRAIVLLQLDDYAAADAAAERLGELRDPIARDFVARYARLRLQRRITAASALIRERAFDRARALLAATVPGDPASEVDLAYARACCAAAEGYLHSDRHERAAALPLLFEALRCAESCLEAARALGHDRLLDLRDKLEREVAALEGDRA